ncbi:ABC transporter ATP-binding protein [Paenibacillus zanthoxyli]|uniref:ABC transporter ATP-binding protein n=1 Tax=Paenibacillus zanthoxyli TaxID=369399 RepID=UPI000470E0C2|nr:ABC transporter ATP-binding protein [Paenibacillus zanthoxyli]
MNLSIDSIVKRYRRATALDSVTLELEEGLYGLLGPNGSGKTTLLRIVADVLRPTSGEVRLNGVDKDRLGGQYREVIGYLPQEFGLYKEFTVIDFMMYIAALKGIDRRLAAERSHMLLEQVGLGGMEKKSCGKLSGGMKRRLGIAQALLNDPKLLILDEPTAGLDPEERMRFRKLISDLSGQKIVLLSTHIVSDIEMIAGELILIENGRLIGSGTPEELLEELRGQVWTAKVTEEEYGAFESALLKKDASSHLPARIVNVTRKGSGVEARILAEEQPLPGARPDEPGLEDLYLHYFKSKYEGRGGN